MARKSKKSPPEIIPRKLAFDVIPAGAVNATLSNAYKSLWARLRRQHMKCHSLICPTCGWQASKASQIEGHEVWVYEPPTRIRLERIDYICFRCHYVIHFDRSRRRVDATGEDALIEHYCRQNGVDRETFHRDFGAAWLFAIATREALSSGGKTLLDYGPFAEEVEKIRQRRQLWRMTHDGEESDAGYKFLPDHEYPEATAMWRDTFGS